MVGKQHIPDRSPLSVAREDKGDGTVSGARITPVETGGDNFGEFVINVKK